MTPFSSTTCKVSDLEDLSLEQEHEVLVTNSPMCTLCYCFTFPFRRVGLLLLLLCCLFFWKLAFTAMQHFSYLLKIRWALRNTATSSCHGKVPSSLRKRYKMFSSLKLHSSFTENGTIHRKRRTQNVLVRCLRTEKYPPTFFPLWSGHELGEHRTEHAMCGWILPWWKTLFWSNTFIRNTAVSRSGACPVFNSHLTVSLPTKQHWTCLKWCRRSLINCGFTLCIWTLQKKQNSTWPRQCQSLAINTESPQTTLCLFSLFEQKGYLSPKKSALSNELWPRFSWPVQLPWLNHRGEEELKQRQKMKAAQNGLKIILVNFCDGSVTPPPKWSVGLTEPKFLNFSQMAQKSFW